MRVSLLKLWSIALIFIIRIRFPKDQPLHDIHIYIFFLKFSKNSSDLGHFIFAPNNPPKKYMYINKKKKLGSMYRG